MNQTLPAPLDVRLMNWTATALFMGCAALLLAALAAWLMRLPAFAITRLVVEGDVTHHSAVTLRANVAPRLTGNFFTLNLQAARAAFEQVPWVRKAQVQRQYPGTLRVLLEEHRPVAHWGAESSTTMVNDFGEVFDASADDPEYDLLPRLAGPEGASAQMLQMHAKLQHIVEPLDWDIHVLEFNRRGSWRMVLDSGAEIELGAGSDEELALRLQRFVRTLTQVAGKYGRRADALESADLRHSSGYALRLRGVTTVLEGQQGATVRR